MTTKEYNKAVNQYSDNVYRFILKNIKDEEQAKDIVQDTFEKLWVKAENVDFTKVKSYIFTTAYHRMIDVIRKNKRLTTLEDVHKNQYGHSRQYSDLNEILHDAIKKLPEIQRSVILLRDYEGYSYEEIAEITNLSLSQVKVYIFRGRKFLKQYLSRIDILI